MSQTSPPVITASPPAPLRSSPSTFGARAEAWVAWLEAAVAQFAAVATNCYNNAVDCFSNAGAAAASAAAASASATAAANSAGAAVWVSGGNYAVGDVRRSPANQYPYRCIASASGRTTDPSTDTGYWGLAAAAMPVQITVSGTSQTASPNGHYLLSNAAASTLTLPGSPADGDAVWITVANGRIDNVVARNGKKIMGLAQDMTIDQRYSTVRLRYVAALTDWRIV